MAYAFSGPAGETPSSALRTQPMLARRTLLLAALCWFAILTAEEWLSIRHLSITVDEGAHTYAGYQHWRARDFGVNPEHPPLVKLVAAAPLLSLQLQQPHPPPIHVMVEEYVGGSQLYNANDAERTLNPYRQFQDGHPVELIGNSVLVYRGQFDVPLLAASTHMSQVPTLLRMHQPYAALAEARTALSLNPQSPMLEVGRGSALLQLGRNQEAQQTFAGALEKARSSRSGEEVAAIATRIATTQHSPF